MVSRQLRTLNLLIAFTLLFCCVSVEVPAQFTVPNIKTDSETTGRQDRDEEVPKTTPLRIGKDTIGHTGTRGNPGDGSVGPGGGPAESTPSAPTLEPGSAIDRMNAAIASVTALFDKSIQELADRIPDATDRELTIIQEKIAQQTKFRTDTLAKLSDRLRYLQSHKARTELQDGLWLPFTSAVGSKVFYEDSAFAALLKGVTRSQFGVAANEDAPSTFSVYNEVVAIYLGPVRLALASLLNSKASTTRDSSGIIIIDSSRIQLNALNELLTGGGNALLKLDIPLVHLGGRESMGRVSVSANIATSIAQIGAIDPRNGAVTGRAGGEAYFLYAGRQSGISLYVVGRANVVWGPERAKAILGVQSGEEMNFLHFIAGIGIGSRVHLNLSAYVDPNGNLGKLPISFTATIVPE